MKKVTIRYRLIQNQLVESLTMNLKVVASNPTVGKIFFSFVNFA